MTHSCHSYIMIQKITSRSANIVCGRKCGRRRAGVVTRQRGDNLWHAAAAVRTARSRSSVSCKYDVDCAVEHLDILIFQHFPFSRAPSAPCRLISEPPHDTVCFLHAPRTAHRAQPPGRAQSGGGGCSARTVYRVIYGDIWDMQPAEHNLSAHLSAL